MTFTITNNQTQLLLNAPFPTANYQTPPGQVVQLDNSERTNSRWRFKLTALFGFQIINERTGMALGVQYANGPTYSNRTDIRVDNPVMEVPAFFDADDQVSLPFATQQWMIRPPGLGSPLWRSGYFELIVSPSVLDTQLVEGSGFTNWVMNAPGNSLSANNQYLPIHVSPDNGGFDNEGWLLTNTAGDSAPFMELEQVNEGELSTVLTFSIANFSQSGGQVFSLPLNNFGEGFYVGAASGVITPTEGNSITCQIGTGAYVAGPEPNNADVLVVAVNAQGYIIAFTTVTSDYWYAGVADN